MRLGFVPSAALATLALATSLVAVVPSASAQTITVRSSAAASTVIGGTTQSSVVIEGQSVQSVQAVKSVASLMVDGNQLDFGVKSINGESLAVLNIQINPTICPTSPAPMVQVVRDAAGNVSLDPLSNGIDVFWVPSSNQTAIGISCDNDVVMVVNFITGVVVSDPTNAEVNVLPWIEMPWFIPTAE
jgi:hypothetical protein